MFIASISHLMLTVAAPLSQVRNTSTDTIFNATSQAQAVSASHMSFLDMFMESDIIVKIVILLLLAASVWSWAIILDKLVELKGLKKKFKQFDMMLSASKELDLLSERLDNKKGKHPLANILLAAVGAKKSHEKHDAINSAIQLATNKEMDNLESNITPLATIATSAPFIGLLGTVWGIMNSFQSIAATQNTSLAVVAPGIAEALLATALGLIAAIPASIFYNKLSTDVSKFANRIEDFKIELTTLIVK